MTSTRQFTRRLFGVILAYVLSAALAEQTALAQSNASGDPFIALQRQIEENSTQLAEANSQIQGFQTQLEDASTRIQELQSQLEDANTQIQQCKSQITDLTQTVVGQQEFIDVLSDRMLFDDGEWVGLREMTLVGPTHFTDADGGLKVEIAGPASGVVTIFGPDDPGPAILSWGPVWVSADEHAPGLRVNGSARIDGPPEGDALRVSGRTRLVSLEPTSEPAVEVVGPAWFRPAESQPATVRLNTTGSPPYSGWFLGPCNFSDAEDTRNLSIFSHSRRPILLDRVEGSVFYDLFSVDAARGENSADVRANSFFGNNMFADNFITTGSP